MILAELAPVDLLERCENAGPDRRDFQLCQAGYKIVSGSESNMSIFDVDSK